MLEIVFKYVGNGDGIVINLDTKKNRVGIIDANRVDGKNPVLDHLVNKKINKLEFIFISHPHFDHYSGILEILDYCESRKIQIKHFGYTTDLNKTILEALNKNVSRDKLKLLAEIYRKASELEQSGLINQRVLLTNNSKTYNFSKNSNIAFLSPTQTERDSYNKSIHSDFEIRDSSSSANILSLVTIFNLNDEYVLLTSDAEKSTLERIGIKLLKNDPRNIVLGQIPHHGSLKNHRREFWKRLKYNPQTPLIISTGPNSHKHPSPTVIDELNQLDYDVHLTCPVISSKGLSPSYMLNMFSTKAIGSTITNSQDLTYTF
ncbi:MAG: hypothetical protein JXR11_11090 [Balneola sp.]